MKGTVYADLKIYRGWKNVPKNLKTRTALKEAGFYIPCGVRAAAQVISQAAFGREGGCYLLYNKNKCRPLQELLDRHKLIAQLHAMRDDAEEQQQAERAAVISEIIEMV